MFSLSPVELLVIGIVAVLLFGGNLPQMAHQAGVWFRRVKRTLQDIQSDVEDHLNRS
ncbi:MAG: twin-arginine translocase TatA/TatE family subunit [Deltaproteobacteria bacterium]|nr:twin-arginine translocase TatA/TatE family subunit [Deltaproteobacteria bacterium]